MVVEEECHSAVGVGLEDGGSEADAPDSSPLWQRVAPDSAARDVPPPEHTGLITQDLSKATRWRQREMEGGCILRRLKRDDERWREDAWRDAHRDGKRMHVATTTLCM